METLKPLAMIICDEVVEDKRTDKKSLIGLFNQILTNKVPAVHKKMHVYFSLTNGRGNYRTILQYSYLPEMKVLGQIHGEVSFHDPNAILECDFELVDVLFPKEGKYNFQILVNDRPIIERIFEVKKS